MKKLIVDIDGVICQTIDGNYVESIPNRARINELNRRYEAGDKIIYFTARGSETGIDWRELTERQFEDWGVKYDALLFNKPYGDQYIDDRAINDKDFFKLS